MFPHYCNQRFLDVLTCIAAVPCWGMFRMFKCNAMGNGTCTANQTHVHIKQWITCSYTISIIYHCSSAGIPSLDLKPTHSVCVGDVGVVEWQLCMTGRVVWETHDVTVGLDVAMADGEGGAVVLWRALEIALLFHLSPHGGVPVVLYSVVSPGSWLIHISLWGIHYKTHDKTSWSLVVRDSSINTGRQSLLQIDTDKTDKVISTEWLQSGQNNTIVSSQITFVFVIWF